MRVVGWVVAACLAACSGGDGIDFENTVPYPGPCGSRYEQSGYSCEFEYDAADRLVTVRCEPGDHAGWMEIAQEWRPEGTLAFIHVRNSFIPDREEAALWTFEATRITETRHTSVSTYDPALFAFRPAPGSEKVLPIGELGLVEREGVVYTWSREGSRLTRTSVDEIATYDLDPAGHVLRWIDDRGPNGTVDVDMTFTYEGDHLTSQSTYDQPTYWRYDRAGNLRLTEWVTGDREIYNYDCW